MPVDGGRVGLTSQVPAHSLALWQISPSARRAAQCWSRQVASGPHLPSTGEQVEPSAVIGTHPFSSAQACPAGQRGPRPERLARINGMHEAERIIAASVTVSLP